MYTSAFVLIISEKILNSSEDIRKNFLEQAKSIEGVESVFIFENSESPYNAIVKITTSTIDSLHNIVFRKISKLDNVKETKTMIIIE